MKSLFSCDVLLNADFIRTESVNMAQMYGNNDTFTL